MAPVVKMYGDLREALLASHYFNSDWGVLGIEELRMTTGFEEFDLSFRQIKVKASTLLA